MAPTQRSTTCSRTIFSTAGLALLLIAACSDDAAKPDTSRPPDRGADRSSLDRSIGPEAGKDAGKDAKLDLKPDALKPDVLKPDAGPQKPTTQWAVGMGGTGFEYLGTGECTAVDSSGNLYLGGVFSDTATFGSKTLTSKGQDDGVVVKLDPTGQVLWAFQVGGTGGDMVLGLHVDSSGNVFAVGSYDATASFGPGTTSLTAKGNGDAFVVKISSTGTAVWAKSFGTAEYEEANSVALDASGNIVIGGFFGAEMTVGSATLSFKGAIDLWLAKLDPTGAPLWAVAGGGTMEDAINSLALDSTGNIFAAGVFHKSAVVTGTGSTSATLATTGSYDVVLLKLDGTGKILWSKTSTSTSEAYGYGVAVDAAGNAITTGWYYGTFNLGGKQVSASSAPSDDNVFVAKHDPSGNLSWLVSSTNTSGDLGQGVAVDASGNALVAGGFEGSLKFGALPALTSAGGRDAFVVKLNASDGSALWAARAGSADAKTEQATAAVADSSGNLYVTGRFAGTASFDYGTATLTSKGDRDLFVWKLQ